MGGYIAGQVVRLMSRARLPVCDARILVLGLAFKENCPDPRNTRVIDLVRELQGFGATVDVHDPWVDADEAQREHAIALRATPSCWPSRTGSSGNWARPAFAPSPDRAACSTTSSTCCRRAPSTDDSE
jgi:hypothetical protein